MGATLVLGGLGAAEIATGAGTAVVGVISSPAVVVVAGGIVVVGTGKIIYDNWDGISSSVSSGWNSAKEFGTSAWNSTKEFGASAWDTASSFTTTTWGSLTGSDAKTKSKEKTKTAKAVPATGGNTSSDTDSGTGSSAGSIAGLGAIIGTLLKIGSNLLENILSSLAYIVYEMTATVAIPAISTATATWGAAIDIPVRDAGRTSKNYKNGMRRMAIGAAVATGARLLKDEEVYRIDVLENGFYRGRIHGKGEIKDLFEFDKEKKGYNSDPTYKYGTTKMWIGPSRYSGSYIGYNILKNIMEYVREKNFLNYYEARILEKELIFNYYQRYSFYPPGNSKLG